MLYTNARTHTHTYGLMSVAICMVKLCSLSTVLFSPLADHKRLKIIYIVTYSNGSSSELPTSTTQSDNGVKRTKDLVWPLCCEDKAPTGTGDQLDVGTLWEAFCLNDRCLIRRYTHLTR